ncbi:TIGR03767 family metallophosphoesterase [Paenarthrobacter sp. PH39-S1]|uniref:TIGR03767 family metallophosphoesterase n=1 Tax=Paenarthrobacter sp. PH39-S1 TaxID=3046204 RepID=UPI0024B9AF59|nr:TIGR03767 family metallophosphoesterase [Paenarthrobacter sp. PH39-S1]MDJ0356574.1 TIGR03767 family metallophosphoesterase [Paenarthrobacter sp. PH39-S1]
MALASISGSQGGVPVTAAGTGSFTTLDRTVVPGHVRVKGLPYRSLAFGPGQGTVVREELCRTVPQSGSRRVGLAAFAQITDTHIIDAASPGRMSFLWQYGDFDNGFPTSGRFRPQDLLTVHVLDAMVRKLNAMGAGPISGRKLDFLMSTGDSSNSYAGDELAAAIDTLNGVEASSHPVTGGYRGVQDHDWAPEDLKKYIWHPEPESSGATPDEWKTRYGYPTVPGFLAAAVTPVRTAGSSYPWYSGFGNHDECGRGTGTALSPQESFIDSLRVGKQLPLDLPADTARSKFWTSIKDSNAAERHELLASMPSRSVQSSELRAPFTKKDFMAAHLGNPGPAGPHGHGFNEESVQSGKAYYTFEMAPGLLGIMLNTASPDGTADGFLDSAQAAWMEDQLASVSRKSYSSKGKEVNADVEDRLVVLFTHHPSSSFPSAEDLHNDDDGETVTQEALLSMLARFPNLILWMNGHQHRHKVTEHENPHQPGGMWEITTASHIDFPQQSRIVEVIDNNNSTLSVVATLIDHSGPETAADGEQLSPAYLASLSLELASNRPGLKPRDVMGQATDQNVELLLPRPF